MKTCIRCGKMKPLDEFYTHPQMADGRLNKCKECCRTYARLRHHKKMLEPQWREAERARSRRKFAINGGGWKKTTPHKKAASVAVNNAVRGGRLVPANQCEDCGHDFSEFRREGHHEDYNKPLDVAWLCALCHGKRHRSVA